MTSATSDLAARPGGRVLADALVAQGIDQVFAVPGESYLDVLDGLYAVGNRINLVTCRFEAGAVNMAEAYGKLTGRPAAAMVTRGPGACHGAIGVHVAMQDSTPMLLFVGQIPFEETDRESFQEVDYRKMFGPLAKWVTQIDDARRIPELVAHAVDVATTRTAGAGGDRAVGGDAEARWSDVPDLQAGPDVRPPHAGPGGSDRRSCRRMLAAKAASRSRSSVGSTWNAEEGRVAIGAVSGGARNIPVDRRLSPTIAPTMARLPNFIGDLGVGSDPALVAKRAARLTSSWPSARGCQKR